MDDLYNFRGLAGLAKLPNGHQNMGYMDIEGASVEILHGRRVN
jgi:hypothetical protein